MNTGESGESSLQSELLTLRADNLRLKDRLCDLEAGSNFIENDELNSLETRLRIRDTALSHTLDFIYLFDLQGRFTYVNHALLSLWRKSLPEAVGKNFFELDYPVALADRLQSQIQHVIDTKSLLRDETPYTGADGSTGVYEYIFAPVFDSNNIVQAVAGSTRNITERKQAEAALCESEERFSAAFAHAPVAMVLTAPDGSFVEANKAYLDMIGSTREEIAARNSDHFTHPDDVALTHAFGEALRQSIDSPAPIEKRYVKKDGTLVWVRASGTMRRDSQGQPTQLIAILEDITEKKRVEEELKKSQDRLQQVFNQAPVAICLLRGSELVFELANPHYQQLFPGRTLLGKPLRKAIPEVNQQLLDILNNVLETGEPFAATDFQVPLDRDEDGVVENYWFNYVYHPLRELDNTVSGVVAVAVDVTAQVGARLALERANLKLEEFAYVASHDLQEPLRMISIYTELLVMNLESHLDDNSRAFAGHITGGVKRLERLLQDLLSFSYVLLTDAEDYTASTADLNVSLRLALETLDRRITEEEAMITFHDLPGVRCDEAQLTQVFQNLLSNALKYRKKDQPPRVSISARQESSEWIISIQDNGIGFDQGHAERIFGLFKRLHKDQYPGTGLGLAICKRIIERYGGRIWAESQPGVGSTFSFALPTPTLVNRAGLQ